MSTAETVERRARPKNRRELILRAAAQLFRTYGYQAVGIDDIGEAVGITGPAVYRHFRNKEELLVAALTRTLDRTLEALDSMDGHASGRAAMAGIVRHLVVTTMQDWDFAVVFRREFEALPAERRREIHPKRQRMLDALVKATAEMHPGLPRADMRVRLEAQYGVLAGVLLHGSSTHRRRYAPIVSRMATAVVAVEDVPAVAIRSLPLLAATQTTRASRRESVLAAAVELFAYSSYPTVGIDEAGTNAGITGPSVYRHFPNKEALLVEAIRRMGDVLSVMVAGALASTAPSDVVVRELTRRFVDIAHDNPDLFVVYFNEGQRLTGTDQAQYAQQLTMLFDEWEHALCRARPDLSPFYGRAVAYGVVGACTRVAGTPPLRRYDVRRAMARLLEHIQLDPDAF